MKPCRRCAAKTALTNEDIQRMVLQVTSMKGVRLIDNNIYEKRISACLDCEHLEYGSTCMLCGCVMQVRARLENGGCPAKPKKW